MKAKNKKILLGLLLMGYALAGYIYWLSVRPVEIVAVHKDGEFSAVLVKNFPFTDKGKINWWLKNKSRLETKYNIPNPAKDGFFSVTFWDFGDGYKEEGKYDRRCFNDMKTKVNCVDKNSLIIVRNSKNMGMTFLLDSGIYRMKKNGEMVKTKYE